MKRKGIGVELLHLHYFRKVAQTGHMSRAARELHISQPALSQTIARLEKELGAPLFDREGRRIRLNAYGEAFLEEVEKALAALEEGKRKVADMAGLERGVISLDATFLPHFPDVMQAFLRLHPDVRFNMSQAPSKKAKEELLASGRIDCCISCSPVELKGCRNEPIKTEHIVLAVPAGHRLAGRGNIRLEEAAEEPFVGFKRDRQFRELTDDLCRSAGFVPRVVCEAEEADVITGLVRSGVGVALLPESLVDGDGALIPLRLDSPDARRTYYLTWREDRYMSKAAAAFRDFVLERHAAACP